MSDQPKKIDRNLSEISHLFLSSVRERQTGNTPRPVRRPPGQHAQGAAPGAPRPDLSIDLTPEEFAQVFGDGSSNVIAHGTAEHSNGEDIRIAPVSAIIGTHLNGKLFDRVKEYAGHLCGDVSRVGLIEVVACEFRLMLFDRNPDGGAMSSAAGVDPQVVTSDVMDPRRMAEAIVELIWDVDRWLLLVPGARVQEARALLRDVEHWVLLSTCDHDGVVSCYRTLKGLSEMQEREVGGSDGAAAHRARLSLALLDATDDAQAASIYRKLSGVCQQFLHWPVEAEAPVHRGESVAEHLVFCCRATRDKAQLASAPQWQVVANFLAKAKAASCTADGTPVPHATAGREHSIEE